MQFRILTIVCMTLTLASFGCDKKQAEQPPASEAQAEATADDEKAQAPSADKDEPKADQAAEKLEKVEVAKAGSKFDPAVQAEQLPAGAWYCDMGTVHWAGQQKPKDGKCPECGMKLKQHDPEKLAAQKKKAVEEHDHDHGSHDHDHGSHDHGEDDHAHGDDHGHEHDDEGHHHAH